MPVLVYHHDSFTAHDAGRNHPERPARLDAVLDGLRASGEELVTCEPPLVASRMLTRVHSPAYVDAIERFCAAGGGNLDPDTRAVPESWEAALRAAGSGPEAIDALRHGSGSPAFLAVRPPGHHALESTAMGFCLFNNIAVAAASLVADGERVAIIDWDVHHGNGTQATFAQEPDVLYVSLHEYPAYPGTGWVDEVGDGDARGTTLNVPFPAGTGGAAYREAMRRVVTPILDQFRADWLLVSAGYDAHAADPLASIRLGERDYGAMAAALARSLPPERTLFFLEGGYDLTALTGSVSATIRGSLHGEEEFGQDEVNAFEDPGWHILERAVTAASEFWEVVK